MSFAGSSFLSISATAGQQPDASPSAWAPLAQKGDQGPSGTSVLSGEVTGDASATVVSAATDADVPLGIVRRDASGGFTAGLITADLNGNASTATNAGSFTGPLAGVVSGTQGATTIANGALTAGMLATGQVVKGLNGLHDAVTLAAAGNSSLSVSGNIITIGSSGVTSVSAGSGVSVANGSTSATVSVVYGGDGSATSVSRSDHTHTGATWSCATTGCRMLNFLNSDTDVNSAGLFAELNNPAAHGTAIWGQTFSTQADSSGVFGWASAAGTQSVGVWGEANGTGRAIYGHADAATAFAGFFDGQVHVNGALSKLSGSFKIDHPLDPENKYLYHSFVESPDMKNLYDGMAVFDGKGEAVVQLPDWFDALNQDFRYQLTAVGRRMPDLYVADEISGNQFRIAGGVAGGKVSWQVTGTRHDSWANAHRTPVEERKPPQEVGTFLFPEGVGADSSRATGRRSAAVRQAR